MDKFTILDSTSSGQDLLILESLHIIKLRPQLNEYLSAVKMQCRYSLN